MSKVTDIILITAIDDAPFEYPRLRAVDGFAGGSKAMQCDVYMAAVNYIDGGKGTLIELFTYHEWQEPECAMLMLKGETQEQFEIYKPNTL